MAQAVAVSEVPDSAAVVSEVPLEGKLVLL